MRTFTLYRTSIEPGVTSEKDPSAYNRPEEPTLEGCEFGDGTVVVRWLTEHRSTVVWANLADFMAIHVDQHPDYGTRIDFSK